MRSTTFVVAVATTIASLVVSSTAWAQVAPPYAEDFESEPTCSTSCGTTCTLSSTGWANDTGDGQDWLVDSGGTVSSSTGPSVDHNPGTSSGKYLYLETSSPCDSQTNTANLVSPVLDLSGTSNPTVRFWYHMYGADMGTLHVDVLDAAGTTVLQSDVIPSFTDNQDLWQRTPKIVLTPWLGQGQVRVRIRGVHSGGGFYGDMAVDDFDFVDDTGADGGIVSIDGPTDCGLGSAETITVTVENLGFAALSNFDLQYTIDGGTPVVETFTGSIAPSATAQFSFATPADLGIANQSYAIVVTTLVAGDSDASNDSASTNVFNGAVPTVPFLDDLEGSTAAQAWLAGGTNSDWALGTPADTVINAAYSGTTAWVTDLTLSYNSSQQSYVESVCGFDLSGTTSPAVRMAIWVEAEQGDDGAALQASDDGGQSWTTVGSTTSGINWYNEANITAMPGGQGEGWTGNNATGSQGWLLATHDLSAFAGSPNVKLRVVFGSDSSVTDEGFAFDDVEIFDNTTSAVDVLTYDVPAPLLGGIPQAAPDALVYALELTAFGAGTKDVTSLTFTNTGNIADGDITWHLYADDGDGAFDPSADSLLGSQPQASGTATFTTTGAPIPTLSNRLYWVSVDLAATATVGATFGAEIATLATDVVIVGNPTVTHVGGPLAGATFDVAERVGTLPFEDDFSQEHAALRSVSAGGLQYPGAPTAGTNITLVPMLYDGIVTLETSLGSLVPVDGSGLLAITYPGQEATGAFQYAFDLSSYAVANDNLWIDVRVADTGDDLDDLDGVFLSLDGGVTWLGSLYHFTFSSQTDSQWNEIPIDLTAMVNAFGADYTDNVVIRFQANDNLATEGAQFDRIFLGLAPHMQVERPVTTIIADGSTDDLGTVPAMATTLTYTIRNLGDFDLDLVSISAQNDTGVTNLVVSEAVVNPVFGSSSTTFTVDFEPLVGNFSFDLVISAVAPNLTGNSFTVTVQGVAEPPEAEIDVQRPAGTSLANGQTDGQGTVTAGVPQVLSYTIENTGAVDLELTSLTIENEDNVLAGFTNIPGGLVGPNETTTVDVQYQVEGEGPFSYQMLIVNNDVDESVYTIIVSGDGEDQGGTGGAGGGGVGGGDGGGGLVGGSGGGSPGDDDDDDGDEDGADDGCGCRVAGTPSSSPWALAAFGLVGLGLARRRVTTPRRPARRG